MDVKVTYLQMLAPVEQVVPPHLRFRREHARPRPADDDQVAEFDRRHRYAPGGRPARVDADAAVHLLVGDVHPVPAEPDLGAEVGGAVEPVREGPGDVGPGDGAVGGLGGDGPVRVDLGEDALEDLGGVGPDLDADVRRVVLPLADAELLDLVAGPAGEDGVEDLGQQQRVDDVAVQLDLFDELGLGFDGGHDISSAG